MLSTAEIRWFINGEIPAEVLDWFIESTGKPTVMPARTDYYLRLPDDGIGIKLREGLLEHKQRNRGVGELWSDRVHSGTVEQWEKWSFPLDDTGAMQRMLDTYPESWLRITKERSMRILEFDENQNIRNTSYEEFKGAACGWELTTLNIEGSVDTWWTMGFEAFGEPSILQDTLVKVCTHVLSLPPLEFKHADSFSYPKWISRF